MEENPHLPNSILNQQLSPNFSLAEFQCHCCGQVNTPAATTLAKRLQQVRDEYGPMRLISAFRCHNQNDKCGGKLFSQHLVGLAADIACDDDVSRRHLLSLLIGYQFPRIGISQHFIHADIGTITGPLIWVY
jgi:uncharacterized protein YcbK (DUF882 family)